MKENIALLLGAPLTYQNLDRMQVDYLSQHFNVYIIDFSIWIYPSAQEAVFELANWEKVIRVNSINDLDQTLNHLKFRFAIDFVGDVPNRLAIAKVLQKHKIQLVIQKLGELPTKLPHRENLLNTFLKLERILLGREARKVNTKSLSFTSSENPSPYSRITLKIQRNLIKPIRLRIANRYIILQTGTRTSSFESLIAHKIINCASNDFHRYQTLSKGRTCQDLPISRYILFIDDCLTRALDWHLTNTKPPISEDEYFPTLNNFFKQIEIYYGLPVVIAGHPNTKFDTQYSENFENRVVVYEKTYELTVGADLVLTHASTAVSFAILANKLLVLLSMPQFQGSHIARQIKTLSHATGSPIASIDETVWPPVLIDIRKRKYSQYIARYLKQDNISENYPMENFVNFSSIKLQDDML